ncbi:MAG: tryptophan-rich sensory protein [Anaerolineales bacterium]|nr:tryptophan-rich sensory protein [Anaerolineales bacterium]
MNRNIVRQIIVVLAVIATIVVNGLANALPLNGQGTGEISDRFQVYFVPAGYVFSIWGLIYIGLILFAVYQALPAQRQSPRLAGVGYLFVLSCLANIVWLFLWHYEQFVWTLVAMFSLLGLLIAIYLRLEIGRAAVPSGEKWLAQLPFSIYLGWVSVATIANVTSTLDYLNWSGWGIGAQWWAVIMLAVGVILAFAMGLRHGDVAYMLVVIWAFAGIAVKQSGAPLVATAAWVAAGLTALLLVGSLFLYRRRGLDSLPAG